MNRFARFARDVVIAAAIIAIFGVGISWAIGSRTAVTFGRTLCYWSVIVGVVSIFAIGSERISGYERKPFLSPDPIFMKWLANEEPFQRIVLATLLATVLDFAIGNLLMIIFWS